MALHHPLQNDVIGLLGSGTMSTLDFLHLTVGKGNPVPLHGSESVVLSSTRISDGGTVKTGAEAVREKAE